MNQSPDYTPRTAPPAPSASILRASRDSERKAVNVNTLVSTLLIAILTACGTAKPSRPSAADPEETMTRTTASNPFIRPLQIYIGHGPVLQPGDEETLGRFDLIVTTRWRYDEIGGSAWDAVKSVNPAAQIYVYIQAIDVWRSWDAEGQSLLADDDEEHINNVARYTNARGHSMGNLHDDNPDLFLLRASGERCHTFGKPNRFLMDFGSEKFQRYWLEAVEHDILAQPWVADGVYMDNCGPYLGVVPTDIPAKYDTDEKWAAAMLAHVTRAARELHARGQKVFINGGGTAKPKGREVWARLDQAEHRPDVVLEEGAFVHGWGSADATFYSEEKWKNQVDCLAVTRNFTHAYVTHSKLDVDASGTDNHGRPVTAWQTLWYGLCSYLLGRDDVLDNAFFTCGFTDRWVTRLAWYDEYEYLDLGAAEGSYQVAQIGEGNIYWRAFDRGYVFVNPTDRDASSVPLPEPCKQLNHGNFKDDPLTLPNVETIDLPAHHGTVLLKSAEPR